MSYIIFNKKLSWTVSWQAVVRVVNLHCFEPFVPFWTTSICQCGNFPRKHIHQCKGKTWLKFIFKNAGIICFKGKGREFPIFEGKNCDLNWNMKLKANRINILGICEVFKTIKHSQLIRRYRTEKSKMLIPYISLYIFYY